MTAAPCIVRESGQIELYFYGELAETGRRDVERHLAACPACRQALDDLSLIRSALAKRPQVDAPPSGDWSAFMARLDAAVARQRAEPTTPSVRPAGIGFPLLTMAALLTLVTLTVLLVAGTRPAPPAALELSRGEQAEEAAAPPVLAAVGQQHLERSKLVLLGLAGRDADQTTPADWQYERELASRLLDDTRLYRLAAEREGLAAMADVMRDLEFVLLQTSLTEGGARSELSQIQRAIRKRDLLHKMDVVRSGNRPDGMGVVRTGT
jgi:hypothetical protein